MTIFDYLLIFVLACSILISTLRGLVKEVLSLLGWIAAFMTANAFGHELATMLPSVIPGSIMRLVIAFIALFVGVRILMWLLAKTIEALVEATGLTPLDRALGSIFGFARGVLIALTVVLLCGATSIPKQEFWQQATLSPIAESWARAVLPLLPGEFAGHVKFPPRAETEGDLEEP